MSESNWFVNVWVVRIICLAILAVGWSAIIIDIFMSTDLGPFISYNTIQLNFILAVAFVVLGALFVFLNKILNKRVKLKGLSEN